MLLFILWHFVWRSWDHSSFAFEVCPAFANALVKHV